VRLPGQLEPSEQFLQLEGDGVVWVSVDLGVEAERVDEAAERRCHVQRLEQTVHIAGSTLV